MNIDDGPLCTLHDHWWLPSKNYMTTDNSQVTLSSTIIVVNNVIFYYKIINIVYVYELVNIFSHYHYQCCYATYSEFICSCRVILLIVSTLTLTQILWLRKNAEKNIGPSLNKIYIMNTFIYLCSSAKKLEINFVT